MTTLYIVCSVVVVLLLGPAAHWGKDKLKEKKKPLCFHRSAHKAATVFAFLSHHLLSFCCCRLHLWIIFHRSFFDPPFLLRFAGEKLNECDWGGRRRAEERREVNRQTSRQADRQCFMSVISVGSLSLPGPLLYPPSSPHLSASYMLSFSIHLHIQPLVE